MLAAQKLFFPFGHCEGVGLGGFLLQGGFGWHSRAMGMGCENVLAIDYVDADGELRHGLSAARARPLLHQREQRTHGHDLGLCRSNARTRHRR